MFKPAICKSTDLKTKYIFNDEEGIYVLSMVYWASIENKKLPYITVYGLDVVDGEIGSYFPSHSHSVRPINII